jgi:4-amino-4-deoxy-L-arabinose transferase-like glycosyltransferase
MVSVRAHRFGLGLTLLLLAGLALRLAVIASPLGEIDGDEAVVGLMARHIAFLGERPVFYWGQAYLGSLEAFTAAPLFRVFDSSTFVLKLVPTAYSLGFLALSALLAREIFGVGVGLAAAAYLAIPPAMWAVWSTKARGGYAELLFLGEALLLVTLALAKTPNRRLAMLWGLLAGLAFWTHLLAVVYLVPTVLYLALSRDRWSAARAGMLVLGVLIGMLPLLIDNVSNGFRTVAALLQPPDLPVDPPAQFVRFFRVGVPVLVGLGQPTTSQTLFDADWLQRPAGHVVVAVFAVALLTAVIVSWLPAVRRVVAHGACNASAPALLVFLAVVVPPVVALTRFGFFVSEPRYALPLYSTVPLLAGALWRLPWRGLRWPIVGLVLAFNVFSLLSSDPRLWRPEDTPDSTAATRAELVQYLVPQDRHQMYTDYWIGYPIMFETRETVLAYVISGGFNRYVPPADNVQRTPNPAWVFEPGTDAEQDFLRQLAAVHGQAHVEDLSVYRVYTDVQPLGAMRPFNPTSNQSRPPSQSGP